MGWYELIETEEGGHSGESLAAIEEQHEIRFCGKSHSLSLNTPDPYEVLDYELYS